MHLFDDFSNPRPPWPKGTTVRNGASLAMHLLVGFPSPWPAASWESVAGFFLQFPSEVSLKKRPFRSISRTADFGRLVDIPFRG